MIEPKETAEASRGAWGLSMGALGLGFRAYGVYGVKSLQGLELRV